MEPQTLVSEALNIVTILTGKDEPGVQKLDQLTDAVTKLGESADNLVAMLPTVGPFAAWAVDLPPVDDFEKQYVFKPISEVIYQGYAFLKGAADKLSDFGKGIVSPAVGLINELATIELPGADKHAAVKAKVLELLHGVGNIVEFFPGGLKMIAQFALSTDIARNWLDAVAGMIAEVLYQVWKVLHSTSAGLPATA